jgi:hypothetical protein
MQHPYLRLFAKHRRRVDQREACPWPGRTQGFAWLMLVKGFPDR